MILKREAEALKKNHDNFVEAFGLLKTLPEERSLSALRRLTGTAAADSESLLASVRRELQPYDDALPTQVLAHPPAQDSEEFRLMLRHATAYPALLPLDAAAVSVTRFVDFEPPPKPNNPLGQRERDQAPFPGFQSPASSSTTPVAGPSATAFEYCDPRLTALHMPHWSTTPISNSLAAALISLYLTTDHPTLGLFDADLFLEDLITGRFCSCSPLLVCSIMVWATNAYSAVVPGLDVFNAAFAAEADGLWPIEIGQDSLPTVAASQLLGLNGIYNNKDGVTSYMSDGSRMAQRMNLFGLTRSISPFPVGHGPAASLESWDAAAAHTAWGAYNGVAMHAFLFQVCEPALEFPPLLRVPGSAGDRQHDEELSDGATSTSLPLYMGRTFSATCSFWVLTSEWMTRYHRPIHIPVLGRVPWAFAESVFEALLGWADGLHIRLARGDQGSHHSTILHIWYHASICELFRPFAQLSSAQPLEGFAAEQALIAQARYSASVNQLKHMTLVFRYTFPCSTYTIFWHVALLHVANAALHDSADPQSMAYFKLCVECYGEFFVAFPAAEGIVRGFLFMALRDGVLTASEAQTLLMRVRAKAPVDKAYQPVAWNFVVDLNLAATGHAGSQLGHLAASFDELML